MLCFEVRSSSLESSFYALCFKLCSELLAVNCRVDSYEQNHFSSAKKESVHSNTATSTDSTNDWKDSTPASWPFAAYTSAATATAAPCLSKCLN